MSAAAALPVLPSDLLACIACVALAAEGSTVQSRRRLSLVCRAWREILRGVPLHVVFGPQLAPERLQAALSSVCVASVELPNSLTDLPPEAMAPVLSALARSAATLTAVYGLPMQDFHGLQLTALTQLRSLTLRVTWDSPEILLASQLPSSLEEVVLDGPNPLVPLVNKAVPWFLGFGHMLNLRRITLTNFAIWWWGSWHPEEQQPCPLQLPARFETVRIKGPNITLHVISTDGRRDGESDGEDATYAEGPSSRRSLRGPVAPMLDLCCDVPCNIDIQLAYRSLYSPVGTMLSWEGRGTRLPPDFTALRMEAHRLHCWADERTSDGGPAHARRCLTNPVHLLCRALRMAPLCYRRFEITAAYDKIHIAGAGLLFTGNSQRAKYHHGPDVTFDSITGLAAAMLLYACTEDLSVGISPDECTIIVRRVGAGCLPVVDAADV